MTRSSLAIWLPWLLSLLTITTTILAGNKTRWAWLLGVGNQFIWLTWIWASSSWGLLPLTIVLGVVYLRNHWKWSGDVEHAVQAAEEMGWVVGNGDGTMFRAWEDGPVWTPDVREALHFCRCRDAEAFAEDDEDAWRIPRVPYTVTMAEREFRRTRS